MHLRTNVVRSARQVYVYTQIVERHRNKKTGKQKDKVLASFRDLPKVAVNNLRVALAASRDNQAVVMAQKDAEVLRPRKCSHNLEYLPVAVLYRLWHQWGLGDMLASRLPPSEAEAAVQEIIAALAIQRCVEPGSKLSAQRWYPTTALSELQGIAPIHFNNTRIHRVLATLEKIEEPLQEQIANHLQTHHGDFVWLALDLSDTWFESQGPPMARKGKTKEGLMRHKIGVALMCEHRGLPMRWKTLQGHYHEATVMTDMLAEVKDCSWVGQRPVIVDRAMGKAKTVEWMHDAGLRFLTAVPVNEFASYTHDIPWGPFDELQLAGTEASALQDLERVVRLAKETHLQKVDDDCFVLDLGCISRQSRRRETATPSPTQSRIAQALKKGLAYQQEREAGQSISALAKRDGISWATVDKLVRLTKLQPTLQKRVLDGQAAGATITVLDRVAAKPPAQQPSAFEQLVAQANVPLNSRGTEESWSTEERRIRAVVVFNPLRFLEQRQHELDKLRELEAFVADFNRRLQTPLARLDETSIRNNVEKKLRCFKYHSCFKVVVSTLEGDHKNRFQVSLQRNDKAWQQRRRYDGFHLFVAHPELPKTAAELVKLYYAKNEVERDFQTIKSVLELRPVRHRSDPKVRAHVSVCMLGLLLSRALEMELRKHGNSCSAPRLLENLKTTHLNRQACAWGTIYSATEVDKTTTGLLDSLGMADLVDDEEIGKRITPR